LERTVHELDGNRREVHISLSTPELQPHFEKAYARAQASIELKGFRKGKVPIAMIKQQFGRSIEAESLETIADEEFRAFVRETDAAVIGSPALTDIKKTAEGVTFTVQYEVLPQFELEGYRGIVVDRPIRNVTDADVEEEIARIGLQNATFEPAEQITDTMHIATITFTELDRESGIPIIGKEPREDRVFLDDDDVDMHLRNSLLNTKIGDTFTYVAETQNENDVPPSFLVTVTDINRVVPAEFTNELAERLTGGRFTTTEELRADIERQIQDYFDRSARQSLEEQIVSTLVDRHSFEPPHALVHQVVHSLFDDFRERNKNAPGIEKLTAHDLEPQLKPHAERIVRWELIRDRIIEAEGISIEDADIEPLATQYNIPADQFRLLLKQNRKAELQILANKAMDLLIDYAIINDVAVPVE
jgi:trigger factor